MKQRLNNTEICEIIELLFDEFSNLSMFDNFFDLDQDMQERYKSKLCERLAEWRDETDDSWN